MWPLSHFDVFVKLFDDAGRPDIPLENKTMQAGFLPDFHQKAITLFG